MPSLPTKRDFHNGVQADLSLNHIHSILAYPDLSQTGMDELGMEWMDR